MPPWRLVRQEFANNETVDPLAELRSGLLSSASITRLPPGARVALAVGSRGIARLPDLVRSAVSTLREMGLEPFIVPAMGSHGGATAAGQEATLARLGVSARNVGAPVYSDMETVRLGSVVGISVYTDRYALEHADAIIPLARIKPHTDFRGPIQSGLLKMLSIGLGNHDAADSLHRVDPDRFSACIDAVGRYLLSRLPVACGIAVVEDAYDHLARVEVIDGPAIPSRERELLITATQWMPRLPFDAVDVLIVQNIGKNIAGTGMDPNITGRFYRPRPDVSLTARCLVVLGLTAETHGNATGIGMADIITQKTASDIDWHATYVNEITARMLPGAKMPIVAGDDREAIGIALHSLGETDPEDATVAFITNTLQLTTFLASEPLWQQIEASPSVRDAGSPAPPVFDASGRIAVDALYATADDGIPTSTSPCPSRSTRDSS